VDIALAPVIELSQVNAIAKEMQLVGSWTRMRDVFDHPRADLDQALPDRRELPVGEWVGARDRDAHAMLKILDFGSYLAWGN
jgi:hypothetical protein